MKSINHYLCVLTTVHSLSVDIRSIFQNILEHLCHSTTLQRGHKIPIINWEVNHKVCDFHWLSSAKNINLETHISQRSQHISHSLKFQEISYSSGYQNYKSLNSNQNSPKL